MSELNLYKETNSLISNPLITSGEILSNQVNFSFDINEYELVKIENSCHVVSVNEFCEVFLAKNKINNKFYSIGISKKERINQDAYNKLMNVVKIHFLINHPNILRLYKYYESEENIYLLYEFFKGKSLLSKFTTDKYDEGFIFDIFVQLVSVMHFFHSNSFIIKDIKAESFLIDERNKIVLTDLWSIEKTSSLDLETKEDSIVTNIEYLSPELVANEPYSTNDDLWSIGILLYEISHGYTPFIKDVNLNDSLVNIENSICKNILNCKPSFSNKISSEFKDVLSGLLQPKSKRMKLNDLLCSSWVEKNEKAFMTKLNLLYNNKLQSLEDDDDNIDLLDDYKFELDLINENKDDPQGFPSNSNRKESKEKLFDIRQTVKSIYLDQINDNNRLSKLYSNRVTALSKHEHFYQNAIKNRNSSFLNSSNIEIKEEDERVNTINTIQELYDQENWTTNDNKNDMINFNFTEENERITKQSNVNPIAIIDKFQIDTSQNSKKINEANSQSGDLNKKEKKAYSLIKSPKSDYNEITGIRRFESDKNISKNSFVSYHKKKNKSISIAKNSENYYQSPVSNPENDVEAFSPTKDMRKISKSQHGCVENDSMDFSKILHEVSLKVTEIEKTINKGKSKKPSLSSNNLCFIKSNILSPPEKKSRKSNRFVSLKNVVKKKSAQAIFLKPMSYDAEEETKEETSKAIDNSFNFKPVLTQSNEEDSEVTTSSMRLKAAQENTIIEEREENEENDDKEKDQNDFNYAGNLSDSNQLSTLYGYEKNIDVLQRAKNLNKRIEIKRKEEDSSFWSSVRKLFSPFNCNTQMDK